MKKSGIIYTTPDRKFQVEKTAGRYIIRKLEEEYGEYEYAGEANTLKEARRLTGKSKGRI